MYITESMVVNLINKFEGATFKEVYNDNGKHNSITLIYKGIKVTISFFKVNGVLDNLFVTLRKGNARLANTNDKTKMFWGIGVSETCDLFDTESELEERSDFLEVIELTDDDLEVIELCKKYL